MGYITGEYYHIFNRGVEKRTIFEDNEDHHYFIRVLRVFNAIEGRKVRRERDQTRKNGRSRTSSKNEKLVEIYSYCLMPNHYHFIVRQNVDNGISKFLQKLGTGYTHYFNKKYERSGVLFQGKTKLRHIDTDRYFQHVQRYIACNPLDIYFQGKEWKQEMIPDIRGALEFLDTYPWLSFDRELLPQLHRELSEDPPGSLWSKSDFDHVQ